MFHKQLLMEEETQSVQNIRELETQFISTKAFRRAVKWQQFPPWD